MSRAATEQGGKPRILCVSFSPIHSDSRVLRQLEVLQQHGDVTTVGYGPAPVGVKRHIEVPESAASLPQTLLGVFKLALRLHRAIELTAPGEKAVRKEVLESGPYDLVVSNDARALPLAFAAADKTPVLADMHEWAQEEQASVFIWRVLVGPYFDYLCRTYLPRASAVTTVSSGIVGLYRDRYGVPAELVRNSAAFQDLKPTPVDKHTIRLVHSGIADPQRNLVELIDAVDRMENRFTLDLYLVGLPGGYLDIVNTKAALAPNVTVHPPVAPATLPKVLNQYDLGVALHPLTTLNKRHHLPNKFFDFVQARLGLVYSPAPEIDAYIAEYGLGRTTSGTTTDALVETLTNITTDDVTAFKESADRAAQALSSEPDRATQHALVSRLLAEDA